MGEGRALLCHHHTPHVEWRRNVIVRHENEGPLNISFMCTGIGYHFSCHRNWYGNLCVCVCVLAQRFYLPVRLDGLICIAFVDCVCMYLYGFGYTKYTAIAMNRVLLGFRLKTLLVSIFRCVYTTFSVILSYDIRPTKVVCRRPTKIHLHLAVECWPSASMAIRGQADAYVTRTVAMIHVVR